MTPQEKTPQESPKKLFTHDFVLVVLVFFLYSLGFHSLTPTLPIYLTRLGSNEQEIGVLVGVVAVAALVSRLFIGRAVLAFGEKRIMLFGAFISALTYLAYIAFRPFFPFLITRAFVGLSLVCLDTVGLACIVNTVPLAYRTRALGYFLMGPSIAMAVAAPVGMFIADQYSFTTLFLGGVGVSLCAFMLSWKIKGWETSQPQTVSPGVFANFLNFKIITPAITTFLQLFVWGAVSAFFPLYAIQCGVTNPGHFFTAMSVTMVVCRIFGGRFMDTCDKEKFMIVFLPSMAVLLMIMSFSRTLPLFIFVGAVWGIGAAFFIPLSMAYALEYVGSSDAATVGTFRAVFDLGMALGPVLAGILVPVTGYKAMFLCLAFICLINLGHFQFYVRRKKS